jgi:hypothetical protein
MASCVRMTNLVSSILLLDFTNLTSCYSKPCSRGDCGKDISRASICRAMAGSISHPRRECGPFRRDCQLLHLMTYVPYFIQDVSKDLDKEDEIPLQQVEWAVLEPYHRSDGDLKKQREDAKSQILFEKKGFCKEGGEGDGY